MPGTSRRTIPICTAAARRLTVSLVLDPASAIGPTPGPTAGGRHHAEFRRERRICRDLALGNSGILSRLAYNGSVYTDNISSYTVQIRLMNGLSGTTAREFDVAKQQCQCL